MSELALRILFAVVAAPLGVGIVYLGGAPLATLLSVIAALGAWELCRMARAGGSEPFDAFAIVAAAAIPLIVHGAYRNVLAPSITQFVIAALLVFAGTLFLRGPGRRPLSAAAITMFAVAYVGTISYAYVIRYHDYVASASAGTVLALLPILITWATDIGAYAFGRAFGRKKLMPSVSPGKTVAGAIGGIAVSLIVCVAYVKLVLAPVAQLTLTIKPLLRAGASDIVAGTAGILLFAAVCSVAAQIGDLAESLLKREAGVKDSSTIIPGHGGVLDRFDSMLFVLPVAALLFNSLLTLAAA